MKASRRRGALVNGAVLVAAVVLFVSTAFASTTYGTLTGGTGRHDAGGAHSQSITTLNSGSGWWFVGFHYQGTDWDIACDISCAPNAGSGFGIPASPVMCADFSGTYNVSCKYP
jgi:hypothetical protein